MVRSSHHGPGRPGRLSPGVLRFVEASSNGGLLSARVSAGLNQGPVDLLLSVIGIGGTPTLEDLNKIPWRPKNREERGKTCYPLFYSIPLNINDM